MKKLLYSLLVCALLATLALYMMPEQNHLEECPISKAAGNTQFHSQFFEDYILSLVFDNIENGTYIDVGANSPHKDSVTKYFYLKGWRGINIEPIKKWHHELTSARPEDINLNVGISDKSGSLEFYQIFHKNKESHKDLSGLSTFDKNALEKAIERGFSHKTFTIPVVTLDQVLEEHPMPVINFLKIDVEGKEKEVLNGLDLSKHRPQIIIIEATEPGTVIRSDDMWKDILLNNRYEFAMFDGLNAYYIAEEYSNLFVPKFQKSYICADKTNKKYRILSNEMEFNTSLLPSIVE